MEGFRRRRDEMILGGVQHVAWPRTVAGKGSPSGLALRAGKLAWERAISLRGLPELSSAPLSLRLIPGVGERQSFVPLFTLSSPSHQHPSGWALCGSQGQGAKGPPNPVETIGWWGGRQECGHSCGEGLHWSLRLGSEGGQCLSLGG